MSTKSAFAPMTPRINPVIAAKLAPKPARPEPVKAKVQTEAKPIVLPDKVELWVEIVCRDDRKVFGWTHSTKRNASIGAIVIVLNTDYWLVRRAIVTEDAQVLAYLLGMSLGEHLTYRIKRNPWIPAFVERLRKVLFAGMDGTDGLNGVQFYAGHLVDTHAFKTVAAELLKPGGLEPGKKHFFAAIALDKHE